MLRGWRLGLILVAGCWTSPDAIDGFTPAQWDHLASELSLPPTYEPCVIHGVEIEHIRCDQLAALGQLMFRQRALSSNGTVSCQTCHDTGAFVDPRAPNAVSQGALGWTKRNAMTVVNLGLKDDLAPAGDIAPTKHQVFSWIGAYDSAGAVLDLAITKAMGSTHDELAKTITSEPTLWIPYASVFGTSSPSPAEVFANLELAFDAYFRRLVSIDAPFDRYLAGDGRDMSDAARRGYYVFAGKGMCLDCHRGPLFTDFQFHNTGVRQLGDHVPASDDGRAGITHDDADRGRFLTPSLRGVALTAPYMHDGSLATLPDVIAFYRKGGEWSSSGGVKDPRLQPIDMTDADALDLEAFLRALTGAPVPVQLGLPALPCAAPDGRPGTSCGRACVHVDSDLHHCGTCGTTCGDKEVCVGQCVPLICMPPMVACGHACKPEGTCAP